MLIFFKNSKRMGFQVRYLASFLLFQEIWLLVALDENCLKDYSVNAGVRKRSIIGPILFLP